MISPFSLSLQVGGAVDVVREVGTDLGQGGLEVVLQEAFVAETVVVAVSVVVGLQTGEEKRMVEVVGWRKLVGIGNYYCLLLEIVAVDHIQDCY